jgi:hypothetical protein
MKEGPSVVGSIETREGGTLLTVETEASGDSSRVHTKGVFPCLVLVVPSTRNFCPVLAALVSPDKIYFSLPNTISLHLSPSPSKLGRQSCRVACLIIFISMVLSPWPVPGVFNKFRR